jgi:hypothetical protein
MSHLSIDRLAALTDEAPTAAELAHLAACEECARERVALRSVADLAGAQAASIGTPLTSWEMLRPVLVAEGIIESDGPFRFPTRATRRPWLQAAAAVLLVAGGVMLGRYSATGSLFLAHPVAVAAAPASSWDSAPTFKSVQDAVDAQSHAQLVYQSALAFIAQHDTTSQPADSPATIRARLAALDETGQVLSEARQKSPYDPVINGYYLTTMGQREATLRQLNNVMPASMQITTY